MSTEVLRREGILLRRHLILHRRALLAAVLIYAAFQAYFVRGFNHATLWLVFTCIYMSFLTVIPLNREDKFGTAIWSCTLPMTRAGVVRGWYVAAWALVIALYALTVAVAILMPGSKVSAAALLQPGSLLLVAGVTTFLLSLLLPFTIRFGFSGVLLMLVVLQLVGAGAFVAAQLTASMDAVDGGIGAAARAVAGGVAALREGLPPPAFYLAFLLALALVNWVSYRISVALFRRREL